MKQLIAFFTLVFLLISTKGFCQKVSETSFGIGFSKTPSDQELKQRWSEDTQTPTFLNINACKNWYRNDRKIALQKEVGLNLQYSKISMGSGGLATTYYYSGKIFNLNAEASLQLRFHVDSMISFAIGPMAEYLLIGYNNLNNSYHTTLTNPPSSGDISTSGINRHYFNQPSFGMNLSIINSRINGKNTLGIDLSYLWTKSESSNFYASNYFQVSFLIGFMHKEKTCPEQDE
jgi:hypothetical protein